MIDYFAIALTHGLLALAVWHLLWRDDLDHETDGDTKRHKPWQREPNGAEARANGDA